MQRRNLASFHSARERIGVAADSLMAIAKTRQHWFQVGRLHKFHNQLHVFRLAFIGFLLFGVSMILIPRGVQTTKSRKIVNLGQDDRVLKSDPLEQADKFLSMYQDTPGSQFIRLLKLNLYQSQNNEEELTRQLACQEVNDPGNRDQNPSDQRALCFAGPKQVAKLSADVSRNMYVEEIREQNTFMQVELDEPTYKSNDQRLRYRLSVYDTLRYGRDQHSERLAIALGIQEKFNPDKKDYLPDSGNDVPKNIPADKPIPDFGHSMACLPLMVAAAAATLGQEASGSEQKVVVEIGPTFGLSSKCLAAGIRQVATEIRLAKQIGRGTGPIFFAYDVFAGVERLKSLQHNDKTKWILEDYFPDFHPSDEDVADEKTNTKFLWERAVQPILPNAHAVAGTMEPETKEQNLQVLGDGKYIRGLGDLAIPSWTTRYFEGLDFSFYTKLLRLNGKEPMLSLLVLNSAPTAKSWNDQIHVVLGKRGKKETILEPGTILVLMDFDKVDFQSKHIYGCLRRALLPVYISWNHGHWIFVVTEPVNLKVDGSSSTCLETIIHNLQVDVPEMVEQMKSDLTFISRGLQKRSPSRLNVYTLLRWLGLVDDSGWQLNKWTEIQSKLFHRIRANLLENPQQWSMMRITKADMQL